jgi:hypothetical protein
VGYVDLALAIAIAAAAVGRPADQVAADSADQTACDRAAPTTAPFSAFVQPASIASMAILTTSFLMDATLR